MNLLNPSNWIVVLRSIILAFVLMLPLAGTHHGKLGQCLFPFESTYYSLALKISKEFKVEVEEAERIISLAYSLTTPGTFPRPLDVLAVVAVESSFQRNAVSRFGPSVGLMQINSGVHKGIKHLREPEANIRKGVSLLSKYKTSGNSENFALTSYNSGPKNARLKCNEESEDECIGTYVKKILRAKAWLTGVTPRYIRNY